MLTISKYTDATYPKIITCDGVIYNSTPAVGAITTSGGYRDAAAVTSLVFSNSGGNLSTGTVLLYGVN